MKTDYTICYEYGEALGLIALGMTFRSNNSSAAPFTFSCENGTTPIIIIMFMCNGKPEIRIPMRSGGWCAMGYTGNAQLEILEYLVSKDFKPAVSALREYKINTLLLQP